MLKSWSPPYPEHVTNYVRQTHCGVYGQKHYACCAWYDITQGGHSTSRLTSTTTTNRPFRLSPPSPPVSSTVSPIYWPQQPLGQRILDSMPCGHYGRDRIAHGEQVRLSEFPWMALLEYEDSKTRKRFKCGASLITNRYVLTAAHCVYGLLW